MKKILVFAILLESTRIFLFAGESQSFQLKNGTIIEGVERIEPQPNGIKIYHVNGIKYAKIHEISDDQLLRYGIDSDAAKNFELQEQERIKRKKQEQVELQTEKELQLQINKAKIAFEKFSNEQGINAIGKILLVLHDEKAILLYNSYYVEEYIGKEQRRKNNLWNSTSDPRHIPDMETINVKKTRAVKLQELVMVSNVMTENLRDGENIKCRIYEFGTVSYPNRLGVENTIPRYTMNAEEAFLLNFKPAESP
jgi:hypothetical protein